MEAMTISRRQVIMYMNYRQAGKNQEIASAKVGISERSGRRIEKRQGQADLKGPRSYRTRLDPLEGKFEQELIPLLKQAPDLEPLTLLEYLQDKYPDRYNEGVLRTLQRRVKTWRVQAGIQQEVMFAQYHPAGEWSLSDFTQLPAGLITLNHQPFVHRLYHFYLVYSRFSFVRVVKGGESYTALAEGMQKAFQAIGGSPRQHRTDHLSAAYKNLSAQAQADLTVRYEALCAHYGVRPTRNNLGQAHENGAVEGRHAHLKRWIIQGIKLRGSGDFKDLAAYEAWLGALVARKNQRHYARFLEEQNHLRPLPTGWACDYTEISVKVSRYSAIQVKLVTYTVPSALIGCQVVVHLYDRLLRIFYEGQVALELPRIYPTGNKRRTRQIDYRHLIHSLVKKPMAFYHSLWQEELLPGPEFHQLWALCQVQYEPVQACRWMVGVLALAARMSNEARLADKLLSDYAQRGQLPDLMAIKKEYETQEPVVPLLHCQQHTLASYAPLLPGHLSQEAPCY